MKFKTVFLAILVLAGGYYLYSHRSQVISLLPTKVTGIGKDVIQTGKKVVGENQKILGRKGSEALKSGLQLFKGVQSKSISPCRQRMVIIAAQLDKKLSQAGNRRSFTRSYLFGDLPDSILVCPKTGAQYQVRLFKSAAGYGFSIYCPGCENELKDSDFRSGAWQSWVKK